MKIVVDTNVLISMLLFPSEKFKRMLDAIKDFYVPVTFEDMANPGHPITIIMYPGDRSGSPLFVDRLTHMVLQDEKLKFNLIDAGWE